MSRSGGDAYDNVANFVCAAGEVVLFGKVKKVGAYFLLFFRGSRHLRDFIENFKHAFGFKFLYSHNYIRCYNGYTEADCKNIVKK